MRCPSWVKSSPARRVTGTAEIPLIADGIAVVPRTVSWCHKRPSLRTKRWIPTQTLCAHLAMPAAMRAEPLKEPPQRVEAMEAGTVGARASWLSRRWGWDKDTIEAVTPMAVPVLMQMVELVFSFLGFSAWPRKQPPEPPVEFNRIQPEFSVDDARRDIVQLRASGELDGMRLSKADFAKRWNVPRSTAWSWLQRFKSEGLIDTVATGMRNETAIRARVNSTMGPRA